MNRKYNSLLIIFFIIIVILMLTSCVEAPKHSKPQPNPRRMELDNSSEYYDQNYKVYTLEGCEYILVGVGKYQWGSHKGNCSNPIHER